MKTLSLFATASLFLSIASCWAADTATSTGSVAGSVGGSKDCASEEHYPLITKTELKNVSDGKSAFIVDVNSSESYAKSHVPGAVHYESHEKDFATLLPQDHKAMVVAYCGGPSCTAWLKAAKAACNMGYTNIRHFKGGISGWDKKGT